MIITPVWRVEHGATHEPSYQKGLLMPGVSSSGFHAPCRCQAKASGTTQGLEQEDPRQQRDPRTLR